MFYRQMFKFEMLIKIIDITLTYGSLITFLSPAGLNVSIFLLQAEKLHI